MKRIKQSLLALGLILMSGVTLMAATATWTNTVDTSWTTVGNWDPGVPGAGNDILFPDATPPQTVDLGSATIGIGTLTFNATNAYTLQTGTLTLGGNVTQSGAGAVTLNSTTDLGGASRTFGGAGAGVVTLSGAVTDVPSSSSSLIIGGGNYVITNSANSFSNLVVTGGNATVAGTNWMAKYDASTPSYFGLRRAIVNGGVLDYQVTTPPYRSANGGSAPFVSNPANPDIAGTNVLGIWNFHALEFGPNGGTVLMNKYPVDAGPTYWFSSAGVGGTVICGQPIPYANAYSSNYNGCWDIISDNGLGLWLGPSTSPNTGITKDYMRRFGAGDLTIILTNGSTAYLDWAEMTNGNLILKGVPNGNSACKETNNLGQTTTDAGRFMVRAPHRADGTFQALLGPAWPGVYYQRAFAMNEGYGMKFYDHLQVSVRENFEYFACDMTFEPGASVDFSGRNARSDYSQRGPMLLGWPANGHNLRYDGGSATPIAGRTNNITIKGGAKLNLNLQMRTMGFEDNILAFNGANVGVHVFSPVKIEAGGEMKIYRSLPDDGGSYGVIELYRPITGEGNASAEARVVVDLPWASSKNYGFPSGNTSDKGNGVNFDGVASRTDSTALPDFPGAELVVNGSGLYGLRVIGYGTNLANLLGIAGQPKMKNRLTSLTGSGGTLTVVATDDVPLSITNGPSSSSLVSLGLDSASPSSYVLGTNASMANFAGLVHKGGTAIVDDASTVTMQALTLAGTTPTIQLGTGSGGAVLNFADSRTKTWTGTLTITSWNGSLAGGGADQIKFGTDNTGLAAGQLAQIRWPAPGGATLVGAFQLSTGEIVPPGIEPGSIVPPNAGTSTPFSANFRGTPGVNYRVLASDIIDPPSWTQIATGTGTFSFSDLASLTKPQRFYKVEIVP